LRAESGFAGKSRLLLFGSLAKLAALQCSIHTKRCERGGAAGVTDGETTTVEARSASLRGDRHLAREDGCSEFKDCIFGMLFLKQYANVFEAEYERFGEAEMIAAVNHGVVHDDAVGEANEGAESPRNHTGFFVPKPARWNHLLFGVRSNVSDGLNVAIAALEESNPELLQDVLLNQIDFCTKVCMSPLPNIKLRKNITHFNNRRLRNNDFEHEDLLGSAYEFLIKVFADSTRKRAASFARRAKLCA
jgi:type I restriction-modification system DNA methylase subunit